MTTALGRVGIAVGSVVAAWLALTLVGGAFGLSANAGCSAHSPSSSSAG